MDIGTVLIWTSFGLTIAALFFTFLFLITKNRMFQTFAAFSAIFTMVTITLAYILLTSYFLNSNFDIHYVWEHSGKNIDNYLKFAGVWAGQEGSILLWVWVILIPLGIEEIIQFWRRQRAYSSLDHDESDEDEQEDLKDVALYEWTRIIVMMVVLLFMVLLVVKDPFEPTHVYEVTYTSGATGTIDPADFPGGKGLNPMLRNFWMAIHPPLLFLGYALITIPFGASIAYSVTGDRRWTNISLQWSRLAWLFLTLGIGIGALWAYVAIGWGGYWYWDAVEVGSLVPWITLSAFMHTQIMNKRKEEFPIITPILATVTFVLVIFATFITRSGLWTSVHAWNETEVGQILLGAMVITLIFSSIFILRSFIIRHSIKILSDEEYQYLPKSWDSILMYATFVIFALLTLITFLGLIVTMKTPDPAFYESRLAPFIVTLLVIMSICLAWRFFGKDNLFHIVFWSFIAAIACAALLPLFVFPGEAENFYFGSISSHHVVGFLIPFVLLTAFGSIYKIVQQHKLKSIKNILNAISPHIIHLGVAFIVISYGASQTMTEDTTERLGVGDTIDIGGYQIKLVDINIVEDTGDLDSNEFWDTWYVTVELYQGGELIEVGEMNIVYSYSFDNTGRRVYNMIMTSEIFVSKMLFEDVYMNFRGVNDELIEMNVQIIPMMSFLWAGMWLFMIGIIVRIAVGYIPHRRKPEYKEYYEDEGYAVYESEEDEEGPEEELSIRRKRRAGTPHKPVRRTVQRKDDDYYEKLLDDELKKL